MSKIRLLTYLVLLVVAFLSYGKRRFLEAPLEPQAVAWDSDLKYWPGHSEDWIGRTIPQAVLKRECVFATSAEALDYRIESRLAHESPSYKGELRQLEFVESRPGWLSHHYRVSLFNPAGTWVILDSEYGEHQKTG